MLPLDRFGKEIEYHGTAHVRKAQQRSLLIQQVTVIKRISLRQLPGRKGQALHGHGLGVCDGERLVKRLPFRFLFPQQDGVLIAGGVQIVLQLLRLDRDAVVGGELPGDFDVLMNDEARPARYASLNSARRASVSDGTNSTIS